MKIVHDKILDLRAKQLQPTRQVVHLDHGSAEAKAAIEFNTTRSTFNFIDSEFTIESLYIEIVKEAVKNNRTYSECYAMVLKYKYEIINNCCLINLKDFRFNSKGFLMYGYCANKACVRLRFHARYTDGNHNEIQVKVHSNKIYDGKMFHVKNQNNNVSIKQEHIRGTSRDVLKDQMKNTKAYPYRAQCISLLGSINLNQLTGKDVVPSPQVLRTLKSEDENKLKRDPDPFNDLIKMKRDNEDFIKFASLPLSVELSYLPACEYYKEIKEHEVVYFDASGSTCGHPSHKINVKRIRNNEVATREKIVLFYFTTAAKDKALLPLHTLISESHDAHNIGFHLKNFKLECVTKKIWPIFRKVMIDFSRALLIALNYAYNDFSPNSTSLEYYKYCYKVLMTKAKLSNHFIVVQGCCAHFAKIVSNDLDRFAPHISKKVKHLIQEAMAYATTTSDMTTQKKWWRSFCIIFGSRRYTTFVEAELQEMCKLIKYDENSYNESETTAANIEATATSQSEKTIYLSSPFYQYFKDESDRVKNLLKLQAPSENEYFIDGLYEHYLEKYMYETCFWTNSMGCLIESGGEFSLI